MTKTTRIENLLLTVWVGSMLAIGYIAAPILFKTLERATAGNVAGEMFSIVSIIGIVCGLLLILTFLVRGETKPFKQWRFWVLLTMVILVVLSKFGLQPAIAEIKALGIEPGSENAKRFGMMHGVSSAVYSLTSLLGVILVLAGLHVGRKRVSKDEISRLS